MLRPNIWVEKIENSPCRVPGWLRLSAARSGSDWSKSFPSDFSKMGELRRRRRGEGGRGAPLARESWPIWATTEYAACLGSILSKFYLDNRSPAKLGRIFFVSVLMLTFLCPRPFCCWSQRTPHFLWTCSQNPNLEMTRQGNIHFYEVRDIKYSSNMQIRFLNSLFVHESWVDVKTVQELHSQSFHPRFLGSQRAPAWALTFLWLVRATSEPACHRNNQTYYSETHCQQASGRESKRVQI